MPLSAGCPHCSTPVLESNGTWTCLQHHRVAPLWRPDEASYELFAEHLGRAGELPTYLPWPLGPGWRVTDFGVVREYGAQPVATVTCSSGASDADGAVDVLVVVEEARVGLGARVAGLRGPDPGPDVGTGPPVLRVRLDHAEVALWAVSTSGLDADLDRMVLAGEAHGRWLWLVTRPASALLMLREGWPLRDVSGTGPALVDLPFGGPPSPW